MSKNEFKGLRHYIDIVESVQSEQQVDEAGILNALGNLGGAVAGTVANGANAVGNAVSGAYDAAKQGVSNAANAVGNAVSGAVDPLVQGAKQGYASATGAPAQKQSASPTQGKPGAKPAAGQPDPNVKALQDKLIAAGAKIKADGIMGPATRAAQAQFPNVTTQTDAEKAVAADINKAEQGAQAQATPAPNNLVNPDSQQGQMLAAQTAGMDAPAQGQSASPTATPNPWEGKDPAKAAAWAKLTPNQQKWLGGADPTDQFILARAPKNESVGYNELQRIVSLVHYK